MGSSHGPVASELEQARTAPEFGAHTSLSEKLLAVAIRAQNFTGSTGTAVALTEDEEMVCRANWGTSAPEVGARLSIEHSFTGICVRTGEAVKCDDAQNDDRVNAEACSALGISAIAAAPIRRGLKVIGVLAAFSDTPHAFTDKHLLILNTLAEVIVEILNDPNPAKPLPNASKLESAVDAKPEPARKAQPASRPEPAQKPAAPVLAPVIEMPRVDAPAPSTAKPVAAPAKPAAASSRINKDSASDLFEEPAATPTFGSFTEGGSLLFRALHSDPGVLRRWLIPAAIFVISAALVVAGWRWHKSRSGNAAPAVAAVTSTLPANKPEPAEAQAAVPTSSEAKPSPFSPPLIASLQSAKTEVAPAPVRTPEPLKKSPAEPVSRSEETKAAPAVVVPPAGPVRRLATPAAARSAQAEPEPPQLAVFNAATLPALAQPVPASIGAPVSKAVPAQLVHRVEPIFPETARRMHLVGSVVVAAIVAKDGRVSDVKWVSGNGVFRDSAFTAVRQWRYKPATLNGQPSDSEVQITLRYRSPDR